MEDFIVWQRAVLCRHSLWHVDTLQFRCRSCSNSLVELVELVLECQPKYIVHEPRDDIKLCSVQSILSLYSWAWVCFTGKCASFVMSQMSQCRLSLKRQRSSTCCTRDAFLCRIFFASKCGLHKVISCIVLLASSKR